MGCACRKPAAAAQVEFDDIATTATAPPTAEEALKPTEQREVNTYCRDRAASDVGEKNKTGTASIASELVHRNWHPVLRQYTVDQFAVLGRGSFGSVCVATNISSGKNYAMHAAVPCKPPGP